MINAIIIDDEAHCVSRLNRLLEEHCRDKIIIRGTFDSADAGAAGISKLKPELVFLDVMLGDKTGFDLLKEMVTVPFDIIFTTAFDTFAVQAFKFSAMDYLLKPIDPDDLIRAVTRAEKKIFRDQLPGKLETLFHNLKSSRDDYKKIAIPTVTGLRFIEVKEIIRCQAEVNYTILFLKDRQKITVAKTLKEFEELLTEHNFFRVHNSHLINLTCVKSYKRGNGGSISMSDDSIIEVASRRKDEFLKRMQE